MGFEPLVAAPWLGLAAVAMAMALGIAGVSRRRNTAFDPRRMFTAEERRIGFARAGNQCEFTRWFFFRCTRTASHGDHYIPWSRGGATSMRNFAAACASCNIAKSAHLPSEIDKVLLQARRARYFPSVLPRDAGEVYARVIR